MRTIKFYAAPIALLAGILLVGTAALAQDQQTAIKKELDSEYRLTQPTAANDDIVTAGSVLTLKMNRITMFPVSSVGLCKNTYRDGKISQDASCKVPKVPNWVIKLPVPHVPTMPEAPRSRDFVKGEKMWVTNIEVKNSSVVFTLFTDPYNQVRYKTSLIFPLKESALTADGATQLIGEVFDAEIPSNLASPQQPQQFNGAPQSVGNSSVSRGQSTPDSPVVVPPPPPPPPDEASSSPTATLGQTTDQVIASLGKPEKVDVDGDTQVYHYPKYRVTFVGGKVTGVQ